MKNGSHPKFRPVTRRTTLECVALCKLPFADRNGNPDLVPVVTDRGQVHKACAERQCVMCNQALPVALCGSTLVRVSAAGLRTPFPDRYFRVHVDQCEPNYRHRIAPAVDEAIDALQKLARTEVNGAFPYSGLDLYAAQLRGSYVKSTLHGNLTEIAFMITQQAITTKDQVLAKCAMVLDAIAKSRLNDPLYYDAARTMSRVIKERMPRPARTRIPTPFEPSPVAP